MMRRTHGKPSGEPNATAHISDSSYIIRKRPRTNSSSDYLANPINSVKPLQRAWEAFRNKVEDALYKLRLPALDAIARSIVRPVNGREVATVCIKMGTAAAAGDRADVFNSILRHIQKDCSAKLLLFQSAHHSTMNAVTQHFETIEEEQNVLVAVEDADLFPENTLKDIVYICGKRKQENSTENDSSQDAFRVSIMFGLGSSADALHSALGSQEATMTSPTIVEMPNATECFKVIAEQVFYARNDPVLFSQSVYDLLEREFFTRETTIATIMRSLHQMYSLHFWKNPLAGVFSDPKSAKMFLEAAAKGQMQKVISRELGLTLKDCLEQMQRDLGSVKSALDSRVLSSSGDEEICRKAIEWYSQLKMWKKRCHVVEGIIYDLFSVFRITEASWRTETRYHSGLRLHVFREFLVTSEDDFPIGASHLGKVIRSHINKAGKKVLQKCIASVSECINTAPVQDDVEFGECLARLEELNECLEKEMGKGPREMDESVETGPRTPTRRIAKGGGAAMLRRKQALRNIQIKDQKQNVLKVPRDKLMEILTDLLEMIEPLGSLPLYETILFSDKKSLQIMGGGLGRGAEPRESFFRAMRDGSGIMGGLAESEIPDTAIAYRLLAEGGRLKNLHDWYNSYSSMLAASAVERDEDGRIKGVREIGQAELQGRFGRACSELELLGLLKYTNRKTDHVLRLTFE